MAMPPSAASDCCAAADGAHCRESATTVRKAAGRLVGDATVLWNLFIIPT